MYVIQTNLCLSGVTWWAGNGYPKPDHVDLADEVSDLTVLKKGCYID